MKALRPLLLLVLAAVVAVPAATASDLTGRFDAGTAYEAPALHAPANVSRMMARALTRTAATASVELPATGTGGMIIWTIPASRDAASTGVATRLITPAGATLDRADKGSLERGLRRFRLDRSETSELGLPQGEHEVVHVMRTDAASYRLELDMPADVAGVTVVAAEPESRITLSTWAAPLSRQPGQPVTLHAELRDGDLPVSGATVTARLASPRGRAFEVLTLTERGDGVYEATIDDLPEHAAGAWQVRFEAEGASETGVRFARTGAGELVAERGAARLGAPRVEVVGEMLRVSVPADMRIAGTYRFDVIVARDGVSLGWAEGVRTLTTGSSLLSIDIPLAYAGSAENLFIDARLLGLDAIGVAGHVTSR